MKTKIIALSFFTLIITTSCSIFKKGTVQDKNAKKETTVKPSIVKGKNITKIFPENAEDSLETVPLLTVHTPPTFEGCETNYDIRKCYLNTSNKIISRNLEYPKYALKNNIQGTVYISYVINKKGEICYIKAYGNEHLVDEAIRVIKLLPKVTPAKQNNKPIACKNSIPLKFKLN